MIEFLHLSGKPTLCASVWVHQGIAIGPSVCMWGKRQGGSGLRRCRQLPVLASLGSDWRRATTSPVEGELTLLGALASSSRAGKR